MKIAKYGDPNGKKVIYFHGTPGAANECSFLESYATSNNLQVISFERFAIDSGLVGQDYFQQIANQIISSTGDEKLDFIGFSIGSHIAIQVARLMPNSVNSLHLVSSASPLDSGLFLNQMAGAPVFKLAQKFPALFSLLSAWQSLLAKVAPKLLINMLFASAQGKDKELLQTTEFTDLIESILKQSYGSNIAGYKRDVLEYVKPWEHLLDDIKFKVKLWHGSEDNWAPAGIADYMVEKIANNAEKQIIDGASHYSCLFIAAEQICRQLGLVNDVKDSAQYYG